jgi:hypothetical protein
MKYLVNLDLNKNELQNARLHVLASAPGSPATGQTYYNSTTNVAYVWNGTGWRPMDAAAATDIPNSALTTNPLARANHTGTQAASTISDLATVVKAYRLDEFAVPTASVSMNSQKITNLAAPTAGTNDAARIVDVENAVQSAAAGIDAKPSVRAATTANITLSGTQTIDGVSLIAGDRVLVKDQSTASANGVYVVAAGAWSRATDADANSEITPGAFWYVEEGTTNQKTQWRLENTGAIVVGTTSLTINQFGAANNYTAGNGLTLTVNDFAVGAGTGISVAADSVAIDTSVVPRKYAVTFGDGAQTSFTITHNLNNQDAIVSVRDVATNQVVVCDVQNNGANTVILSFAAIVASNALRATVIG